MKFIKKSLAKKGKNNPMFGKNPFNKGTHIQTNTGRTHFKKGQIPWNKGIKCPNISKSLIGHIVDKFTKNKISKGNKGKKRSLSRIKQMRKFMIERYNKIGRKVYKRPKRIRDRKYQLWRTSVFKRDNYTCQDCHKVGGYLEAHHIKAWSQFPKLRYIKRNGKTLCFKCHHKYGRHKR